jgi:hypothetical protein
MPFWTADGGPLRRQCTREFKIRPVQRRIRELLGYDASNPPHPPASSVELWMGITIDEWTRAKPSRVGFITHRWPLIDLLMSRRDCEKWFAKHYPDRPPLIKSACLGCPYHSDRQWREIKRNAEEWADVIEVDRAIRNQPGMNREQFMHRSLRPIDEVDFSTPEERGQINMFENECEGMCGL